MIETTDKKLVKDIVKGVVIAGISAFVVEFAKWGAQSLKARLKKEISKDS